MIINFAKSWAMTVLLENHHRKNLKKIIEQKKCLPRYI